jgi:GDP-4-dehydro-6-deoxy-D-mannose reductase
MPKILITGFNGFVGRHACAEFRRRGFLIHGVSFGEISVEARQLVDLVSVCDLSDPDQTSLLELGDISAILNLAGFATNTGGDGELIRKINVGAHVNLYARVQQLGLAPRIIAVSSGSVYDPDQPMPESERSKLKDVSKARPYEASKILMEQALSTFIDNGLDIVIVRPFNHIGPGQGPGFIVPDLANKIIESLRGDLSISTGNLETMRDYTDVRDVVRAYADLVEAPALEHKLFNICSGTSIKGSDILDMLLRQLDPDHKITVEGFDASLVRTNDPSNVFGSYVRLAKDTDWSPSISMEQTIEDFCAWRLVQEI